MPQALDFSKPDDITNIVSVASAQQFPEAGITHHPGNSLGQAHLLINLGRQINSPITGDVAAAKKRFQLFGV